MSSTDTSDAGDGRPFFTLAEPSEGSYDPSGASIVNIDDYPRYDIAGGVVFCPVFAGGVIGPGNIHR